MNTFYSVHYYKSYSSNGGWREIDPGFRPVIRAEMQFGKWAAWVFCGIVCNLYVLNFSHFLGTADFSSDKDAITIYFQ